MLNEFIIRGRGAYEGTDSDGCRYARIARFCRSRNYLAQALHFASVGVRKALSIADKLVRELTIRSFGAGDWKIGTGTSGKFHIFHPRDGVLLKKVNIFPDYVKYEWTETEGQSKEFGSLEDAQNYSREVLSVQTYRDSE